MVEIEEWTGRTCENPGSTQSGTFRTPPSSWIKPAGGEKQPAGDVQASVERELERQMFEYFKEENFKLGKRLKS